MEMIERHEMMAFDAVQALEVADTKALQAAGVQDIMLEGDGAADITAVFQETFWVGVAEKLGDDEAAKYRAIVDAANDS